MPITRSAQLTAPDDLSESNMSSRVIRILCVMTHIPGCVTPFNLNILLPPHIHSPAGEHDATSVTAFGRLILDDDIRDRVWEVCSKN
jgi:hypothetical protein